MTLNPRAAVAGCCALIALLLAGCPQARGAVCGDGKVEGREQCDDGNPDNGDGCELDCKVTPASLVACGNGKKEGSESCDDGNAQWGDGCEPDCSPTQYAVEQCPNAAPASSACAVTAGNGARLFTGVVLANDKVLNGGQVLVDGQGIIQCVGCDCSGSAAAQGATQVSCPGSVITPGLINSHDHLSFQGEPPFFTDERYEHRHDWRVGGSAHEGHNRIDDWACPNNGSCDSGAVQRWAELRQVMAGTTSVAGSGGTAGLLRNLDRANTGTGANQEGLGVGLDGALYDTFPLGDSGGAELTSGCAYPAIRSPSTLPTDAAYLPHVSEGISTSARNEFLCLSGQDPSGRKLTGPRTAMIHGIGLTASDIQKVAEDRTTLIWSPRSNISLYGDTAAVPVYRALGVQVALGTDWLRSGSMNILRELRCADFLNQSLYRDALTEAQLWKMVTSGGADAMRASQRVGRLLPGLVGDLAVFRGNGMNPYRAIIEARSEDVVLTVRGAKALYGDQALISALTQEPCDAIDVCGVAKAACLQNDIKQSFTALRASVPTSIYPLFTCNGLPPPNEPTCGPARSLNLPTPRPPSYVNLNPYVAISAEDLDGDGVANAADDCPNVFNPIRPMDNGKQADADGDGAGDLCDPCPLAAGATTCPAPNPEDPDGDGVANGLDNCPYGANPGQEDADADGKGNVCDPCVTADPGVTACVTTLYAVKTPAEDGSYPFAGSASRVSLKGLLVTAVVPGSTPSFYAQVPSTEANYPGPDYSGVFFFRAPAALGVKAGDVLDIADAGVALFGGQLQLGGGTVTRAATGRPAPAPVAVTPAEIVTGGTRAAALEGVLVRVTGVTVASVDSANNELTVDNGLKVSNQLFTQTLPAVGAKLNVTGVLANRNGEFKLNPRAQTDITAAP